MKYATLLSFLCMLFLSVPAMRPPDHKDRMRALKKEYRALKRECKLLRKHNNFLQHKSLQLKKIWDRAEHNKVKFEEVNVVSKPQHINNSIIHFKHDTCLRDSNLLKQRIASLTLEVRQLKRESDYQNQFLAQQKQQFLDIRKNRLKQDPASLKKYVKLDKLRYRLESSMAREKERLKGRIKALALENPTSMALRQQQQLLQQMRNPGFTMPSGYQTKSRVYGNMPANKPESATQKAAEVKDKIEEQAAKLSTLNDSIQSLHKDSLLFKPNPYQCMRFKDRIKPGIGWQTAQKNGYYPAALEWLPSLKYLWTPKLTPVVSLIVRTGLGRDLEHLQISYQGVGIQGGMEATLYKQSGVFLNYAQTWYPKLPSEIKSSPEPTPSLHAGIFIKGKLQLMIGYNFLYSLHPDKGSPLLFRFNL